ncbi:hypothetical protein A2765_05055 [Candidatus Kaiserbacteria bacterium RIFCSPHIGHO2_01_FULL_56_24]|uniref:Multidrug resistance protein MdtA-like barrel-sandwich hybrid domain-containing protein n=1 Tax=Candidatus Kaiserbacteria bacterium RIFCSPHIGHO2_01_FULL_56_24 TaxID=1798487 RepID=A0A1F6D9T9_9BACT|nr:MAG: hypothetical protein A2765_05055 [Candidatus Kaiserbacteria bacterium RIFCSPHIGHO2_01_FULL_56_24]
MSTYFSRIGSFLRTRKYYVAGAFVLILLIGGAIWRMASSASVVETTPAPREVVVASVADLMSGTTALSVVGEVRSKSEAKISTEAGGIITGVNVSLGSSVGAGTILAEIENSSQRAAVQQAEGVLDAAKASVPNLESTLESAKGGALTTLLSAYAAYENAMRDGVDPLFALPNSSTPNFNVITTTDSASRNVLENTRPSFNVTLARYKTVAASLSKESDLGGELVRTEDEVRKARNFLDTLLKALNAGVSSPGVSEAQLTAYKTEASDARTSLTSTLSAITAAWASLEVASNNTDQNASGSSASQAALKQAEGAYNATLANLEKTRIRAPISGTLNNFSIKLGDNVSAGQQVAVVSNNGALEVVVYVTREDKANIIIGQKVMLEGDITGTITKIAPALDPTTHRIEVRIGLPANATAFTNGESVRVALTTNLASIKADAPLSIPIAALKIEASRTIVFTVVDNRIVATAIKIGKLSADSVQVSDGLTLDTVIVTDARGLKEGDEVRVAQ